MNNNILRFERSEEHIFASVLASLQYHGVKFSVDRDGETFLIVIK